MISFPRPIPFLLAGLLAGCVVGPDYHPPKTAPPAQWASPQAGGETNLPAAGAAWWKSFHDAELDSLVVRAAQSNLNLRAAVARVREARAAARVVAAGSSPALDVAGSYERNRFSANGVFPFPPGAPLDADVYQAGFDAAWELDVFGGTRRASQAARAEVAAAEFGRRNLLVTIFAEVARNYVQARAFQRRLAVADENISAQEQILALTRDRFAKGLTGELDVQEADALLATTRAQAPVFETGFRDSVYQLALLLGQPPGALLEELTNAAPIPAAPPAVPVGLPADLLQRRPDVQQAERQLAAATARVGAAVSDLYPKFSLTGDVGLQSISPGDWFNAGSRFWTAGPTVQWRIFDAGRIRANIRVQNARVDQALAAYEQSMLAAFTDVETALTAYAREQTRRQSLAHAAQAGEQAVALARDLYQHGLADFLRVLEAQRSLYQSQDALIESDRAVSSDLIALYKALGGGWEP
ncbi:MAG: efflux transporter outer membrane subunit [Verrucomicrobiota bacterium]|jgi:NodT family efflux transporter outer membrane factor (OMF) lipoprotein